MSIVARWLAKKLLIAGSYSSFGDLKWNKKNFSIFFYLERYKKISFLTIKYTKFIAWSISKQQNLFLALKKAKAETKRNWKETA